MARPRSRIVLIVVAVPVGGCGGGAKHPAPVQQAKRQIGLVGYVTSS